MSFRRKLTLFFVGIVVIPMIVVAVVVFVLVERSQTGQANARLAQGQTAAAGLLRRDVRRADLAAQTIGADPRLALALRGGGAAAVRARATELAHSQHVQRLVIRAGGRVVADVGSPRAVAPATRRLVDTAGSAVAEVEVSMVDPGRYVRLVHDVTGLDVVLADGSRTLGSSLADARAADVPASGKLKLGGRGYRVASFGAPSFGAGRLRVSVLSDEQATGSAASHGRLVVGLVLLGLLLLAFAFAVSISRTLQAQVLRLLEAARRLGAGDFSHAVPVEGRDEFAQLGLEFNKMSGQLQQRIAELAHERARMRDAIRRTGDTLAANLDRDALLELSVPTFIDAVHADVGRVVTRDGPELPLAQRAGAGRLEELHDVVAEAEAMADASGAPATAERHGAHALAFPMVDAQDGGLVTGVISVGRAERPFTAEERELFASLASQAVTSIENVDLHQVVKRQAVTDGLTGLFNHRRFQEVVSSEVERARRFDQPLALVMLDLDGFKLINDAHGHQQGDRVLREVARILGECSREIDEPARYGGDELAVALPQTDLEGAFRLAERVRTEVARLEVPRLDEEGYVKVTASLGVAALPVSATTKDGLVAAADAALYTAKRAGKNQTQRAGVATASTVRAE